MKHHPHHEEYDVLTATQAKMSEGEGPFSPGYTGKVASHILAAISRVEFKPHMRIECNEYEFDESDDFEYAVTYCLNFESLSRLFIPRKPMLGINRFS